MEDMSPEFMGDNTFTAPKNSGASPGNAKDQAEEDAHQQVDHFSFHSDDSYDLLVDCYAIHPRKPSCIPLLNLYGLPEYETSSDEDEAQQVE